MGKRKKQMGHMEVDIMVGIGQIRMTWLNMEGSWTF